MREFSQDEALNREYDQFLSVTVAVYLGGGLFFLVAIALILRFEYPFDSLTKLGQVEFSSGSSRCYIRLVVPTVGKAFSDSLTSGTVFIAPQEGFGGPIRIP